MHADYSKCTMCQKGLPQVREFFLRHKQTTCDLCDRVFLNFPSLYMHINTFHDPDLPYQCTACTMRFKTDSFLKRHFQFNLDCNLTADMQVSVPNWVAPEWKQHKCQAPFSYECYQCQLPFINA